MMALGKWLLASVLAVLPGHQSSALVASAPVNDRQLAVMMFVDYGRSYGYQVMMVRIQVDTVKAQLERDQQLLSRKRSFAAGARYRRSSLRSRNSRMSGTGSS